MTGPGGGPSDSGGEEEAPSVPAADPYAVPSRSPRPAAEFYSALFSRHNVARIALGTLLTVLSLGTFLLLGRWFPRWACRVWRKRCSPREAAEEIARTEGEPRWFARARTPAVLVLTDEKWTQHALARDRLPDWAVGAFKSAHGLAPDSPVYNFIVRFSHRGVPYHYHPLAADFVAHEPTTALDAVALPPKPVSDALARLLRIRDGRNTLSFPLTPFWKLLLPRLLSPFFVFQVFASAIWMYEGYITFSVLVFVMSFGSVTWEAWSVAQAEKGVRAMSGTEGFVSVLRPVGPFEPIPAFTNVFANLSRPVSPAPDFDHLCKAVHLPTSDLVLGDIVVLPDPSSPDLPMPVPADLLLLQGGATVDESGLTGESAPVIRTAPEFGSGAPLRGGLLNAGSRILATSPPAFPAFPDLAPTEVDADGFPSPVPPAATPTSSHARGGPVLAIVVTPIPASPLSVLHRSLLFPTSPPFKFYSDSLKFLAILFAIAVVGVVKRVVEGIQRGTRSEGMWVTALDMITIAIPPALPIVLTIGTGFSLARLRARHGIGCIDPPRINFAGRVTLVCWDKTGTLTREGVVSEGLEAWDAKSGWEARPPGPAGARNPVGDPAALVMATCHSVLRSAVPLPPHHGHDPEEDDPGEADDGLLGQPLELAMFRGTGCALLAEPEPLPDPDAQAVATVRTPDGEALHIMRRFAFDNALQLSSSVVLLPSGELVATVKGSPDSVRAACDPATLPAPDDWDAKVRALAGNGMYVLAMAVRAVPADALHWTRGEVERGCTFAGLLLMRNPVKQSSAPAIAALKEAAVRNVMVTGDDVRTGIWVARKVGIVGDGPEDECYVLDARDGALTCEATRREDLLVPPALLHSQLLSHPKHALAVTARCLELLATHPPDGDPGMEKWVVARAAVLARIRPTMKTRIVEEHIARGEVVAMCGDGMNDCGALKAAHVGLALSDAEASIVAPFTSRSKRVSDMVKLLMEGRCALETSFTAFKFMLMYPVVQLTFAFYLQHIHSNIANNEYFFDDLIVVFGLQLFMLNLGPADKLSDRRPTDSLFHPQVVTSILGQILLFLGFFTLVIVAMYHSPWFCSLEEATVGLDPLTFQPLPGSDPDDLYPCYVIDPDSNLQVRWNWLFTTYENNVSWLFGHTQFYTAAWAFTAVSRFRAPIWTDTVYVIYLLLALILILLLLLTPPAAVWLSWAWYQIFGILPDIPSTFRLFMTGMFFLDFICCVVLWEWLFVDRIVGRWVEQGKERDERKRTAREMREAQVAERASMAMERSKSGEWLGMETVELDGRDGDAKDVHSKEDEDMLLPGPGAGAGRGKKPKKGPLIPRWNDRIF
ncbi:hypothetical protein DFJ74DRAFT_681076 [Hyaloraphidium curvatum]|nr:hypothetical protein DFJ74DRAFT_681076 [Hyaloraphidium curvatum]